MFNTNDIVRWRGDGSLETFGRGDDQVKIKVSSHCPTFVRELNHPGISSRARRRLGYYREVRWRFPRRCSEDRR